MCKTFMFGAMKPVSLLFDQPTYVLSKIMLQQFDDFQSEIQGSFTCLHLKTHFGLHNTLMTLSSLEIRNFGALCISYR